MDWSWFWVACLCCSTISSPPILLHPKLSEILGFCLAAFSAMLPYLGRFLELIAVKDILCIRGCWDTPEKASRAAIIDQFKDQIQQAGLCGLTETLYFPRYTETQVGKILPKGVLSVVVHPIGSTSYSLESIEGLVLVAYDSNYAYSDKDITWIKSVANEFQLMAP